MNKRLLLASILFVFITLTSQAQDFRFGLHFSPNIAWTKPSSTNLAADGSGASFGYGLIAEFNLGERYAIATGLTVLKNSLNIKYADSVSDYSTNVKMQYLEIPVALKLKTNEIGAMTYFGKFGLTPQFRLKSMGSTDRVDDVEASYNKVTLPLRMGLLLGFGAEYSISGSTHLLFGLDFNNGFTKVFQNDAFGKPSEKPKAISNFVALNLGVIF